MLPKRWIIAALVPLLGAFGALGPVAAAEGEGEDADAADEAPRYTFDWPVPGRIAVTEVVEREHTAKMRYVLETSRTDEGLVRIRYRDFRFVEVDGEPVDDELKEELGPALPLLGMIPDILVEPSGTAAGLDGLDRVLKEFVALSRERGDERAATMLEQAAGSPVFQRRMEQAALDAWNAWVGAWVGVDLPPGERRELVSKLPVGDEVVEAPMSVAVRSATSPRGAVEFEMRVRFEASGAPQVLALLGPQADRLRRALESDGEAADLGIRRRSSVTATTDPDTLVPSRVETREETRILHGGEEVERAEDRHVYTFEVEERSEGEEEDPDGEADDSEDSDDSD